MSSLKELPQERLASMDETGKRVFLHPADVKGRFKRLRIQVHAILLVLFLVLPWIQIGGHQAILLDIAHRRFTLFGLAFWAHDAPMLMFVFGSAFIGISLITAVWGRLWCGWGCPETVFTESVYRAIERLIEGNSVQRQRLDKSPWNFRKIRLRAAKWSAFLVVTLIITHSFMAYFVGVEALGDMMRRPPSENLYTFGVMAFISATLLFSFGWFREQFCIIVCPYGRFQAVLMDDSSMTVLYDTKRGEPRRGVAKSEEPQGDCINCYRCVQVCPTGIDIRRGVQLECVACTACIDVCDEVMLSIHKEPKLIGYNTLVQQEGKKIQHFRPRVVILSLALLGVLSGLVFVLTMRAPVKITIFNAKTVAYQVLTPNAADPQITNPFMLTSANYTFGSAQVQLVVLPEDKGKLEIIAPQVGVPLPGGQEAKSPFFLKFPQSLLKEGKYVTHLDILTRATDGSWQRSARQEVHLVGPY